MAAAGLGVPVTWCVARRLLQSWRCVVRRLRLRARLVLWVWSCRMWFACWWVPDIARVLPLSLVYGPVLVLASDILGRVLVMPSELEVGIVTAFIGAPVLMVLVLRLSTGARGAKKGRMVRRRRRTTRRARLMCRSTGRIVLTALLWVVRLVRLAYLVRRSRFLRGFIVSVVSRSVAGSVVAGSVRIPGRYRTPIPRTLLVVAVLVVAAVASLVFGSYQMSPDQLFA